MKKNIKKEVLIMASGGGTNAEAIAKQSKAGGYNINFSAGCNRQPEKAGVYKKLGNLGINVNYLPSPKKDFSKVYEFLEKGPKFDLIVLAGYMRVLPADITKEFNILNIHPSILPFVYKGSEDAYADAINNGDIYTGCTVHKVTTEVDGGPILAQIAFEIPEFVRELKDLEILKKIGLAHEHALYWQVIISILSSNRDIMSASIDMKKVLQQSKINLIDRGLPKVDKFIPEYRVFSKFDAKEMSWMKECLYGGR